MSTPTAYHQLGQFIVTFQHIEEVVRDLIVLMANTDDGMIQILANDLEYSKIIKAADVLFARFVDIRKNTRPEAKREFHDLIGRLVKLGERRNELVHSRYNPLLSNGGKESLLRTNSKLSSSKGAREEKEEELSPAAFDDDLQCLRSAEEELDKYRLQIIDWL